MSATRPRLQARSRWSQAARCPRSAAYGLLGVTPEDERLRDDVRALMRLDLDGLRRRGRRLGDVRAEQYAARYGADNIIREKEVEWSAGTMHTDVFVIPEKLAVEVKSVLPGSIDTIFDAAILQCAGQIHYDDDAESGLVEFMSPVDETVYEAVPVTLNPDLIERVEAAAHAVARAGMTNGAWLPERVCAHPKDSASHLCPFKDHCFADWTAPEAGELDSDEALALAQSLYELKSDYRKLSAEADERKEGYALVQAALAELGVEPGRDYMVGPYKVKRIVTAESESFSLSKARKTGNWTEADAERFAPFVSPRAGSERWSVDLVGDATAASGDDFGSEAPWEADDL